MLETKPLQYTISSLKPNAYFELSREITNLMEISLHNYSNIVVLCIGTDRSTGDCLGPLVGEKLTKYYSLRNIHILGTLDDPVHAKNLSEKIDYIYNHINNPFVIAIDASLGKHENVGNINLFHGPLSPGAGVNKTLPSVGDISLTGVVNISGFMEYVVLQNTRLSLVMKIADVMSLSLYISLKKFNNYNKMPV